MSKALAKHGGKKGGNFNITKGDGVGTLAQGFAEFGGHALLAIASKNLDSIGPIPVRPDVAGLVASGAMMLGVMGKKGKKLGKSLGKGALHAIITRFAYQGPSDIFSVKTSGSTSSEKPPVSIHVDARGAVDAVRESMADDAEEAA